MAVNTIHTPQKKNSEEYQDLKSQFREFIVGSDHPCIMAQSVVSQEQVDFHTYEELGSKEAATQILSDIKDYLGKYDFESNDFFTFVAAFKSTPNLKEEEFESLLWKQLQFIHEEDGQDWDEEVSRDPENSNFSFSISGKAFYIVGMHPQSSRKARQSPFPLMVFNLHWQFERLREMGAYHNVRDKIRQRDMDLQGSVNPMLEDFGKRSEARQYSGRNVGEAWKCPFLSSKE